jgi:hypothetical protein
MSKKRLLLIGDNRAFNNWGGRGATPALVELFSERFDVFGTVPAGPFHAASLPSGYIRLRSPRLFRAAWDRRRSSAVFEGYLWLEHLLGARDFVDASPERTAGNILRYGKSLPELARLYEAVAAADVVVVNGEGDCLITAPPRRILLFYLGIAELAISLRKPVLFANMLLAEVGSRSDPRLDELRRTVNAVLEKCTGVIVREPASFDYVRTAMPNVRARLVPDSMFRMLRTYDRWGSCLPPNGNFILPHGEEADWWNRLDFTRDYVCVGGGAATASRPEEALQSFTDLVTSIKSLGLPICLVECDGRDHFLRQVAVETGASLVPVGTSFLMGGSILGNARLFVSGRYHPSILAAIGGTPCVFLGSDGGKTASLKSLLEYDSAIPVWSPWPTRAEVSGIVELAKSYLADGASCRGRIRAVAERRCAETETLPVVIEQMLA